MLSSCGAQQRMTAMSLSRLVTVVRMLPNIRWDLGRELTAHAPSFVLIVEILEAWKDSLQPSGPSTQKHNPGTHVLVLYAGLVRLYADTNHDCFTCILDTGMRACMQEYLPLQTYTFEYIRACMHACMHAGYMPTSIVL